MRHFFLLGHDSRLRRNWLKRSLGDALHAVLYGAKHNFGIPLRASGRIWRFPSQADPQIALAANRKKYCRSPLSPELGCSGSTT
jgi:hypothetical protein